MSHFNTRTTSPHSVMMIAYVFISIIGTVLYLTGFYDNSKFFNWGPPITFFEHDVDTNSLFYTLHALIFVHQVVNNYVNSVVYPWIMNSIQDPKNKELEYNKTISLLIINAFNIYSELDLVFIIGGFTSQISFIVTIILANTITSTYINNRYINQKQEHQPLIEVVIDNYTTI